LEPEKQVLDLKKWFNSKHYLRLWNVGPPGFLFSVAIVHGLHYAEQALLLKTFSLSSGWLWGLMTIVELDAIVLLVWVLFSLPPKERGIKLSKKGIYGFIRHPIYTAIVYHMPILYALSWGSFLILFFLPVHHMVWGKLVGREEKYLVGIFGQEYLDYMNEVPRFVPWPKPQKRTL
jgi:protein-S-isoprenylcysteine O-methyltransferase Ste14